MVIKPGFKRLGQGGSAVKSFMLLSLLITGVVIAYLNVFDAKSRMVEDGPAAVQPRGELLTMELRGLSSQHEVSFSVDEQIGGTEVVVTSGAPDCDLMLLNRAYQTCAMHRVQQFRDKNCKVFLRHLSGECTQP